MRTTGVSRSENAAGVGAPVGDENPTAGERRPCRLVGVDPVSTGKARRQPAEDGDHRSVVEDEDVVGGEESHGAALAMAAFRSLLIDRLPAEALFRDGVREHGVGVDTAGMLCTLARCCRSCQTVDAETPKRLRQVCRHPPRPSAASPAGVPAVPCRATPPFRVPHELLPGAKPATCRNALIRLRSLAIPLPVMSNAVP